MQRVLSVVLGVVLLAGSAVAQDFPARPIKVIVPYPAGGLVDTVGRIVTEKMAATLGQSFVLESKAGANGTVATAAVASAPPDGYTLLLITDSHGVNPLFYKGLPYDSEKDFAAIGLIGKSPMVLTVNAAVPAKTLAEFIALAKASPGKITYGSIGVGSASHLAGELFKQRAGVDLLHVPYRGGAPAVNDLIAGHLNAMFLTAVIGGPHVQAGSLRALAVAATARLPGQADVPTMAEAGLPLDVAYWIGLAAPAGTPPAVVQKLEKALLDAVADPEIKTRLTGMGAVVTPLPAQPFTAFIHDDLKNWAAFVAAAKINPQ